MFFDRFVQLCQRKGVKPGPACVEMGLSRSLAAKWKSTKTEKPSADALEKMSAYFGISIDEILGVQKENPATVSDEVDPVTMELFSMVNEATQDERQVMLEMLRLLKKQRGDG